MRWASTVATSPDLERAVSEAAAEVRVGLGEAPPDLAIVFVSQHHEDGYARVPALLRAALAPAHVIGCSAGGVIGGGREVERRAGVSLTAAALPGVDVAPFHVAPDGCPGEGAAPEAWHRLLGVSASREPQLLVLADPFTFDAEHFVAGVDTAFPGGTTIGGLASGGHAPETNALYLDDAVHRTGLVGVALGGDVRVDTIVAQGCRPIGDPMFVTRCDRNVLMELDGRRPLEILEELVSKADARDRELFAHSLFLGIVMREQQHEYHQGDFLIRNVVGLDRTTGVLAIGALLRTGAVVQFHLRDARTSAEDLETLLAGHRGGAPAGALLFSCLGRGVHLYGRADHDTEAFRAHLGDVPLGGFFCNGEIGPVHGTTFVHGYTSSFGLFRPRGA
jgi:small ligand-binding sensory domain FIST